MTALEPGARVLILHDFGGFTPATYNGREDDRAWCRVTPEIPGNRFPAPRPEPLSAIAEDTPENRARAEESDRLLQAGLRKLARARAAAAKVSRLQPVPAPRRNRNAKH